MSIYFVGDIQGCYSELSALLKQVNFTPEKDQLWVAGDLVARGPDSYKTIKYLMSLGDSVKAVLGNHDLHLLAIYDGLKKAKASDHFVQLLSAPDVQSIIDWLSQQPLLRKLPNEKAYMSHAGISPQWTIEDAERLALLAQQKISSQDRRYWLKEMYGEQPNDWLKADSDVEKFRFTVNAFTRMRYCYLDGTLDFACKDAPKHAPQNLKPWFSLTTHKLQTFSWVFGHWAALMGNTQLNNIHALDTGCVWGEHLTLLRWHDKALFIENSHKNLR